MRVCYLDCHEAGLCCYLVIHTENLLHPLQLLYFHLWPVYWLTIVSWGNGSTEGLMKTTKIRIVWYPSRDLNLEPPEYETGLATHSASTFCNCSIAVIGKLAGGVGWTFGKPRRRASVDFRTRRGGTRQTGDRSGLLSLLALGRLGLGIFRGMLGMTLRTCRRE
jgi:hypothetical protein